MYYLEHLDYYELMNFHRGCVYVWESEMGICKCQSGPTTTLWLYRTSTLSDIESWDLEQNNIARENPQYAASQTQTYTRLKGCQTLESFERSHWIKKKKKDNLRCQRKGLGCITFWIRKGEKLKKETLFTSLETQTHTRWLQKFLQIIFGEYFVYENLMRTSSQKNNRLRHAGFQFINM